MDVDRRNWFQIKYPLGGPLRLLAGLGAVFAVQIGSAMLIFWRLSTAFMGISDSRDVLPAGFLNIISVVEMDIFITFAVSIVLSALLVSIVWITLSRRIFGAAFAIHRKIGKIGEGDRTPFKLRDKDEFKEIERALNQLSGH